MLRRHEITIWGICVVKTGPLHLILCTLALFVLRLGFTGRAYDMLEHLWFKPATKSRNDPDTCFMIATSWGLKAGGWNQCFVPDLTPKCLRSILRGKGGDGGHGWQCSKIFTPRTDSIFSQLNGGRGVWDEIVGYAGGMREGGWHVTRVGPLRSLSLLITGIKIQSAQPTSQNPLWPQHTLHFLLIGAV